MIQSMTGFGRSEGSCFNMVYIVEVRSVNHRYCDISIRLPEELSRLEHKMRSSISGKFSRGKFDVYTSRRDLPMKQAKQEINIYAIRQYKAILKDMSKHFNTRFSIRKEIGLSDLICLEKMMILSREDGDFSETDKSLMDIFNHALDGLMKMRLKEGAIICRDLKNRIRKLESLSKSVVQREPQVIRSMKKRYTERIKELTEMPKLDMDRLHQELAIMIDRMDITEEIVRIKSHIVQLGDKLEKGGVVGRSLDFLLQEINREINTIASKTSDMKISRAAIEMKTEVERIREQVQNIE